MHVTGNLIQTSLNFKGDAPGYTVENSRGNVGFRHGVIRVPALLLRFSSFCFPPCASLVQVLKMVVEVLGFMFLYHMSQNASQYPG